MADSLKKVQGNVTEDVYNAFMEFKNEHEDSTYSQLIELLLERYKNPIKVNESTKAEAAELKAKVADYETDLNTMITESQHDKREIERLNGESAEMKNRINELMAELEQAEKGKTPVGYTCIKIDPRNLALLKFVAERESKKRNQEWTIDDVINYFVHFRFEKGSLNGDLDSVPDSVVKRFIMEEEAAE